MEELDDLGAVIPPKEATRQLAAAATELATNPAFVEACRALRAKYFQNFRSLQPDDPLLEKICTRTQMALSIIDDVAQQLQILADGKRFEDLAVKRTAKGR